MSTYEERKAFGDCLASERSSPQKGKKAKFKKIVADPFRADVGVSIRGNDAAPRQRKGAGEEIEEKLCGCVHYSTQRPDTRSSSSSAGQTVIMRQARSAATRRRKRTSFAVFSA
jgi:hypothetical protein